MSYTLEDDEVAVIIRPSPYTEGDWHGHVTTGISYDNDSTLTRGGTRRLHTRSYVMYNSFRFNE